MKAFEVWWIDVGLHLNVSKVTAKTIWDDALVQILNHKSCFYDDYTDETIDYISAKIIEEELKDE